MNAWFQFVAGNIVVATLIGGLAWQVGRSGRRAKLAHLLWVAVFVKLITPPIVLLPITVPESWLPATAASVTNSFPYRGLSSLPIEGRSSVTWDRGAGQAMFSTGGLDTSSSLLPSIDGWTCVGLIWFYVTRFDWFITNCIFTFNDLIDDS